MPTPVHNLCYLAERDDAIVPVARPGGALEPDAYGARDLEIHAFTTAGEVAAFAAGLGALASNRLRLGAGIAPLAHLAVLERLDADGVGRLVLVDHGGARSTETAHRWNWLIRFARAWDRTGHRHPTVMFQPPLRDRPAELKIDRHRFTPVHDGDDLVLNCPISADVETVRARLAAGSPDLAGTWDLTPDGVSIRVPRAALRERIEPLHAFVQILSSCEFEEARRRERASIRRDRSHCRIVERMLEGWTLRNNHGRGELAPPAGNPARTRDIGYAMLDRLIAADLVRAPDGSVRGSSRGWNTVYAVGDLAGTDVRPRRGASRPDLP